MEKRRIAGYAVNALLRASTGAFLIHALRHPHDPRYEGKAIPVRNLLIVGSLSLAFPLLALCQRRPGKAGRANRPTRRPRAGRARGAAHHGGG